MARVDVHWGVGLLFLACTGGVPTRCNVDPCCVTADVGSTRKLHTLAPVRWGGACSGTSQDCEVTISGLIEVTAVAP